MRPSFLKSLNLDVIVEMIEMACRLEKWDKVVETSEILYECVQYLYQEQQYRKAKSSPLLRIGLGHPLVYYYGFSYLTRGMAYLKMENYEEARVYIDKYAEMGWLEDLGEDGLEVVEEFRFLAQANGYALELISGQVEVLNSYTAFLRENPEEVLPGLDVILQATLRYGLDVDELLKMFAEQTAEFSTYEDDENLEHCYSFSHHLALYHKRAGRMMDAMEQIVQAVKLAYRSGNDSHATRSLALFESLRDWATVEQVSEIQALIKG
ncbi:DNA-binding protein [Paenibacillus sp. LMG 31459]|uniref:DNA-binding protein n=1 Tax=Paenibacillus phytohabitans TaxID=2654978 RepID=A0ABX1YIH5_9BACL|nr:DNA-binding protein [Paenibacillus phytohabitans]